MKVFKDEQGIRGGKVTMKVMDPVCKMSIEEEKAAATSSYKGKTYYFCSKPCKEDFDKDPESYLGTSRQPE
jgi:YHS domain-containing protein